MSKWTGIAKHETIGSIAMSFVTVGILGPDEYCYTIEDEAGNGKNVIASDNYASGEAIAEGNFFEGHRFKSITPKEPSIVVENKSENGGNWLNVIGGFVAFVVIMAIISMAAPAVGRAFEAIFGFGIITGIVYLFFRIFRRRKAF